MKIGRFFITIIKLFLLLVVAMMVKFQMPELRYDFGTKEPVVIVSPNELTEKYLDKTTFVSIQGKPDFSKAATFSMHGVTFTYFLLENYNTKLVVRTSEPVNEDWDQIKSHLGRLRVYHRMPFSRSVRTGFSQKFDVNIPDNAFFLARDDAPKPNGWNIGAMIFAGILWFILFYFFFLHKRILKNQKRQTFQPG